MDGNIDSRSFMMRIDGLLRVAQPINSVRRVLSQGYSSRCVSWVRNYSTQGQSSDSTNLMPAAFTIVGIVSCGAAYDLCRYCIDADKEKVKTEAATAKGWQETVMWCTSTVCFTAAWIAQPHIVLAIAAAGSGVGAISSIPKDPKS